mmetsp:Transcript_23967/g.30715  ORF Transcript_23967/g.30715 Transcript_23967/m.30715 type:complete len:104 (-) Transcript_23967:85-396(-)
MAVPTSTRNRNGISGILSVFKCCCKSNITRSQHFHAHEDSVHVMMKHDANAAKKNGALGGYVPRARFPDSLAAGRQTVNPAIQATEATGESNADKQLLAALRE